MSLEMDTTTTASQIGDDDKSRAPSEPITTAPPPAQVSDTRGFDRQASSLDEVCKVIEGQASSLDEVCPEEVKIVEQASSLDEVSSTLLHGGPVSETFGIQSLEFPTESFKGNLY